MMCRASRGQMHQAWVNSRIGESDVTLSCVQRVSLFGVTPLCWYFVSQYFVNILSVKCVHPSRADFAITLSKMTVRSTIFTKITNHGIF
jgi:hypothetical protein